MTIFGTCYFPTLQHACTYYRDYGLNRRDVSAKVDNGEIHLGSPPVKDGERIILIDGCLRYGIAAGERR